MKLLFFLLCCCTFPMQAQRITSRPTNKEDRFLPACEVTIAATVAVSGVHHVFWMTLGGGCRLTQAQWDAVLAQAVPVFLQNVLSLFPGQGAQILYWGLEWG